MLALKTENQQLPQNPSPAALLFKEKRGIAEKMREMKRKRGPAALLRGVFDSRENERKEKKMRENKIAGKFPPNTVSIPAEKKK